MTKERDGQTKQQGLVVAWIILSKEIEMDLFLYKVRYIVVIAAVFCYISMVTSCQEYTRQRELKRIRTCLSEWSFYKDSNEPAVQELFQDEMKNEICKLGSRDRVQYCILHLAGRCTHLLVYWRHVYDPISHICDFEKDFDDSKKCRNHPTFTKLFQVCQEEYLKIKESDKDCWQYKWHKDCIMTFVQSIDECRSGNATPLIDRALFFHYRHLAAYNHCKYEHNKELPDVTTSLTARNQAIVNQS